MKKALVAVVAVVVLGLAVYSLWPRGGRATPAMEARPRLCEECGHRFAGPTDDILLECPQCHKRAGVRVHVYACRKCVESFEAFHSKCADASLTAIDPMKPPPALLYRVVGGEWTRSWEAVRKQLKCPKCASKDVGHPMPR